ncbi:hypothetical protein BASA82_000220 [Batrachochytrium salamandrivorans]|nr:hypothetical protein BASA82_000220 [Batrachochytrium salamandrivorans]
MTWMSDVFAEMGYADPFLMTLASSSSAIVGNAIAYGLMDLVPHPKLLLGGLIAASLSALGFVLSPLPAACAFSISITVCWTSLGVVSSEAFPYISRATKLGVAVSCGRLGSILANALNPLLLAEHLILPVAGLSLLLGAIVVFNKFV